VEVADEEEEEDILRATALPLLFRIGSERISVSMNITILIP